MPDPGLSLLGFLDEPNAIAYLQQICITSESSPETLSDVWKDARQRLGKAVDRAGRPHVQDLPSACSEYAVPEDD